MCQAYCTSRMRILIITCFRYIILKLLLCVTGRAYKNQDRSYYVASRVES